VLSCSVSIVVSFRSCHTHNLDPSVVVTLLSVMLDNTGFIKAGPKQSEFEPQPGKTVKFSDVQGVDEAKEVGA
jgi:ATP-dependent Zn protease